MLLLPVSKATAKGLEVMMTEVIACCWTTAATNPAKGAARAGCPQSGAGSASGAGTLFNLSQRPIAEDRFRI